MLNKYGDVVRKECYLPTAPGFGSVVLRPFLLIVPTKGTHLLKEMEQLEQTIMEYKKCCCK